MPTDLERAAKAYRDAQARLAEARAQVGIARNTFEEARETLAEAIVAAYHAGMRQIEIVRVTGYTRETVRVILRTAGVEPD
jgi:hypothetical protein